MDTISLKQLWTLQVGVSGISYILKYQPIFTSFSQIQTIEMLSYIFMYAVELKWMVLMFHRAISWLSAWC